MDEAPAPDLRDQMDAHMMRFRLQGVRHLPRASEVPLEAAPDAAPDPAPSPGGTAAPAVAAAPAADPFPAMADEVDACRKCALGGKRQNAVFGTGSPEADLVFVGEAPGAEEDRQGLPFVGRAGELLTKIIEAMGLTREQVYIANILKCRPPNNRDPDPQEILNCSPYLWRQLEVLRPRVICALGGFAARTLLETDLGISRLRGRFHDLRGYRVMPTYHPAYLLRNPAAKRAVWEDVQKIMAELGLPASG